MLIVRIFIFHRHKTPVNKEFQEEGERLKDKVEELVFQPYKTS
ncbi:hypothetical protein [Bacteroides acidifaciens]|nr:hypothetical protein [Bacteroides acidifaciens]